MKIASFSLFGRNSMYCIGAVRNAELMKEIYPDWTMRVYIRRDVPDHIVAELQKNGVELIYMPWKGARGVLGCADGLRGAFWRFLPLGDPACERVIIRDADSRINIREKAAVDAWLASSKSFHVMHDNAQQIHPDMPIAAGMWGGVGGLLPMEQLLSDWSGDDQFTADQRFLATCVWPKIKDNVLHHVRKKEITTDDEIGWPAHPPYHSFVGAYVTEREEHGAVVPQGRDLCNM